MGGFAYGLGMQANAATLFYPGTELLSDTPEFLDFKFNQRLINVPYYGPGSGPPPGVPRPALPILLGQYWNVFAKGSFGPFIKSINLDVQRVVPGSGPLPQASFAGTTGGNGTSAIPFSYRPTSPEQITYLADASPKPFFQATCPFGSDDCVSYEFVGLSQSAESKDSSSLPDTIFELKGFFKSSQQVSEPETDIGALAALGLMLLVRFRKSVHKSHPKPLS
jgi:hypothetical protein